MKALVTGASGFIGSTLVEELVKQGLEVRALLRKTSSRQFLESLPIEIVEGELSDRNSLQSAVKGTDYVFHVAGAVSARDQDSYFRHNTQCTMDLAQSVAQENPGLRRFVFVSSLAAGGPSTTGNPRTETDPDQPISIYGESKLQAEKELLIYKNRFPITVIRPPMVYGPKDKGVFVAIQAVSKNWMPLIRGGTQDGHKYYSAIHASDLCRGVILAGLANSDQVPSGEVFYLSQEGVFTYQELLMTVARHLERSPRKIYVPKFVLVGGAWGSAMLSAVTRKTYSLNLDKLKEIFPDYWICSSEKAKRMLGFSSRYDLSTGLLDAIQWYRKEKWI